MSECVWLRGGGGGGRERGGTRNCECTNSGLKQRRRQVGRKHYALPTYHIDHNPLPVSELCRSPIRRNFKAVSNQHTKDLIIARISNTNIRTRALSASFCFRFVTIHSEANM